MSKEKIIICTSSIVEALELYKVCTVLHLIVLCKLMFVHVHIQQLQLHSWSVCHVDKDFAGEVSLDTKLLGECESRFFFLLHVSEHERVE